MRKTPAAILWLITAGTLAVWAGGAVPARPGPEPPRSLDDRLLEDLGADPVDEFDRQLFGPDQKDRAGESPGEGGEEDLGARLQRELGTAAVAEEDLPLLEVARRMREVEGRIAQNDSGLKTQRLQGQIVAELDELIRQARKRCGQSSSGGSPSQRGSPGGGRPKQGPGGTKPSERPAPTSAQRTGNGEKGTANLAETRRLMQELWKVALPKHQREQMMQWSGEEFLPKYEVLIEQYFRRLSEEKDDQ